MILRKMLIGGAAVAAMTVVAATMPSAVPGFVTPAQADVDVSISIGTFYDELAPYGDWVNYNNTYVFVPAGADPGWKPYTRGHWEYTKRYGWVWISDERHGWATHHYGRWGYGPGIGWYWVPDTRWAPAWVDWRRDDEYVAWAPLAPGGDGVSITVGAAAPEPLPDYYWAAVAAPNFLAPNIAINIIDRDDRVYDVVRRARPIGHVRYRGDVVVNNFIDIDYVEKRTKKKVVVREVRDARSRDEAGRRDGNQLAIYNPRVERKGDAKPKRAESVEAVARKKRAENPEFAARTEEREKRRALKRETEEADKKKATETRKEREKAKDAKQQPAEEAAAKRSDEQAAKKKAREERAAKQQEEQNAKKAREERAAKSQENKKAKAEEDDRAAKQKQREERAAKQQENQKAKAENPRKKQKEEENPSSKQRKKKEQQESLAPSKPEAATQQARAKKTEERQAKRTEGEAKKKKKKEQTGEQ